MGIIAVIPPAIRKEIENKERMLFLHERTEKSTTNYPGAKIFGLFFKVRILFLKPAYFFL
jgi:hypothetical protein